MAQERKIGVFVCYCGGNISDFVDVEKVREEVAAESGVVIARTHLFTCSDAAQQEMIEDIKTCIGWTRCSVLCAFPPHAYFSWHG